MDLVAEGRMAEVFAIDDDTVVKLDRREFNGVALHEAAIMRELARQRLPIPDVTGTVVIDGRHGVLLERLRGPVLSDVIRSTASLADLADLADLAEAFVDLHIGLHAAVVPDATDLVQRLAADIARSGLPSDTRAELVNSLSTYDGEIGLCHFDLHPNNVIVTESGWRVIDWVAAAMGPTLADFARTMVLRADGDDQIAAFMSHVRLYGTQRRSIADDELDVWMRIVAAARLSEGFVGDYASRLRAMALGAP